MNQLVNETIEVGAVKKSAIITIDREQSLGAMFRDTCLRMGPKPAQWRKKDAIGILMTDASGHGVPAAHRLAR